MEKRRHQVVQEVFTKLGYDRVKPEQMTAIEAFISGMDICHFNDWFSKTIIVSPLLAFMQDQVQVFFSQEISSACISSNT